MASNFTSYPPEVSDSSRPPRVSLLGYEIDNLSMDEALAHIEALISKGTGHSYFAVNVHKVVSLRAHPELREVALHSNLVLADGQPIVWASRLLGYRLKERVPGIDLMQRLVELAARRGYRVYFLGARPEVLRAMVEKYRMQYSALNIVGIADGYWKPEQEYAIAQTIKKSKPDILFVAMGSPRKEFFIRDHLFALDVPFVMGVGGSFDVVAGVTRRAPPWMRQSGMEWFWRVLQEPGRMWKRYFWDGLVFPYLVLRDLWAKHSG